MNAKRNVVVAFLAAVTLLAACAASGQASSPVVQTQFESTIELMGSISDGHYEVYRLYDGGTAVHARICFIVVNASEQVAPAIACY